MPTRIDIAPWQDWYAKSLDLALALKDSGTNVCPIGNCQRSIGHAGTRLVQTRLDDFAERFPTWRRNPNDLVAKKELARCCHALAQALCCFEHHRPEWDYRERLRPRAADIFKRALSNLSPYPHHLPQSVTICGDYLCTELADEGVSKGAKRPAELSWPQQASEKNSSKRQKPLIVNSPQTPSPRSNHRQLATPQTAQHRHDISIMWGNGETSPYPQTPSHPGTVRDPPSTPLSTPTFGGRAQWEAQSRWPQGQEPESQYWATPSKLIRQGNYIKQRSQETFSKFPLKPCSGYSGKETFYGFISPDKEQEADHCKTFAPVTNPWDSTTLAAHLMYDKSLPCISAGRDRQSYEILHTKEHDHMSGMDQDTLYEDPVVMAICSEFLDGIDAEDQATHQTASQSVTDRCGFVDTANTLNGEAPFATQVHNDYYQNNTSAVVSTFVGNSFCDDPLRTPANSPSHGLGNLEPGTTIALGGDTAVAAQNRDGDTQNDTFASGAEIAFTNYAVASGHWDPKHMRADHYHAAPSGNSYGVSPQPLQQELKSQVYDPAPLPTHGPCGEHLSKSLPALSLPFEAGNPAFEFDRLSDPELGLLLFCDSANDKNGAVAAGEYDFE